MFDDARPIFVQLAEQIEDDVLRGVYAEESQVPSTNELAAFLRINPATAGKALNRLVDAGVLYKRRGIGMFISAGAKTLITAERQRGFAQHFIEPLVIEAKNLGFGQADVIRLVAEAAAWTVGAHEIRELNPEAAGISSTATLTESEAAPGSSLNSPPQELTAKEAAQ